MLKHSWKITVPITIVVIFGISIAGYALIKEEDFTYRLLVELKDWLKIETEVTKGQGK
jgi:hypothetical protein